MNDATNATPTTEPASQTAKKPRRGKAAPAPKAAKKATKGKKVKVVAKKGRTSALADWMRQHGINPKVGRAKLRRKGIDRVLNDKAIKALTE